MTDNNQNKHTVAVQASVQEMAKMRIKTNKSWHKKLIQLAEQFLTKVTKLPINISISKDSIMLNASAIFWFEDKESKKFVMLKSNFAEDSDIVTQFPFVACYTKDSVSLVLDKTIKDLFGKAFAKSLAADCFASDKISSAPTVVIADEDTDTQTVLHNMVWSAQITPEQFELIQNHSDQFQIVAVPEYEMDEPQIHEIHKFLYQSCLRHIHQMQFTDIAQMKESLDEMMSSGNKASKTLH
jgi:hypothetical protein